MKSPFHLKTEGRSMRLVELLKKLTRESETPTPPIQQKLEDWKKPESNQNSNEDADSDESDD